MPAVDTLIMQKETLKDWERAGYDGIMGMGKRNTTDTNQTSFLTKMGVNEFTLCLGAPGVMGDASSSSEERAGPPAIGDGIGGRSADDGTAWSHESAVASVAIVATVAPARRSRFDTPRMSFGLSSVMLRHDFTGMSRRCSR